MHSIDACVNIQYAFYYCLANIILMDKSALFEIRNGGDNLYSMLKI